MFGGYYMEFQLVCKHCGAHVKASQDDIKKEEIRTLMKGGPDEYNEYYMIGGTVTAEVWYCPACRKMNTLKPVAGYDFDRY